MTKRSTKHSLIMSAIALLLCFSMLIGTTFAWFTDSVTSAGNIIKSGTLEVTLHYAEGTEAVPTDVANWTDASAGTIFNYDKWEPGYTDVKHIRIGNDGTLALKYAVTITAYDSFGAPVAPDAVNDLAEVIDVYYLDPAQQVADRNAFDALPASAKLGTLKDVLANLNSTATGSLEAGKSVEITLALKMQETAGNEYQDKSIGDNFAVTVFATQMTYEEDSFDDQYDKDAYIIPDTTWYESNPSAAEYTLTQASELAGLGALVESGKALDATIKLGNNINLSGSNWNPIGVNKAFNGTFDGCGYTISGLTITNNDDAAFFGELDSDAVIKNVNFENVDVNSVNAGVLAVYIGGSTIENVHVLSGTVNASSYGAAFAAQQAYYGATFNNCTNYADVNAGFVAGGFGGYIWYDSVIENCTNYGNITGGNRAGGIASHVGGIIKNCVNNGEIVSNGAMSAGGIVAVLSSASTFEDCVNNGNVTNNGTDANNSLAGGILAVTPGSNVTIKNCVNNGNIYAANSDAAGIATSHYGTATAIDCENNGDVYGATGAAGTVAEVGMFGGNNTVTNCTNSGTVTEA